jgi:hypothetical protein
MKPFRHTTLAVSLIVLSAFSFMSCGGGGSGGGSSNSAPVANAGADQDVASGSVVSLDGSGCSDVDGDSLTYIWSFSSVPLNSSAAFSNSALVNTTFTADVEGDYAIQLIVNDGTEDSLPGQVTVHATYAPGILPDTGQTSCYDSTGALINCAGTGQDGEFSINPMSFTDNGNGTVTDNVTGLIWQQDVNPMRTWSGAKQYCESLVAGGYTDWRLPATIQLVTLIDYSWWSPAIDFTYFPNIQIRPLFSDSPFWAKELYTSTMMRHVDFVGGAAGYLSASTSLYSRCVRTDPPPESLTDNADGTVRDNNTALIWQQLDDNTARAWANALTYCNDLALPAINESYFLNTVSADYWTSTSRSTNPSDAWFVDFDWGNNYWDADKATANYVRCVR